jgi:tetratricopeptide (TPR) repeat protein
MKRVLLGILISFFISLTTKADSVSGDKNYRQSLKTYYLQDKELLITQDVVDVAQAVISNRNQYSQNMIARAFSLLSDVAFNRGNLVAAFQFAQYGSETNKTDVVIQLDLLLKIARGYYAQGEYIQLRDTSQKAARLAEHANNMNYHLQALAYSVVAYALSADYDRAVKELSKVERLLSQNQQNVDLITLLEIIAEAHFYLSEYDNAVELLNRVLKLRTDMSRTEGIARSYHLVANAYYQLQHYDDAYNAFWQSLQFAKQYKLNIREAYAELGLGQVLYKQQQFRLAKTRLLHAQAVFNQHNLVRVKLSTQIALIKVMYALGEHEEADSMLLTAESVAESLVLSPQQIELFLLLTEYYIAQKQFEQSTEAQKHYLTLYQGLYPNISVKKSFVSTARSTRNKAKNLALNLVEQSQLSLEFSEKYNRQRMLIILLSAILSCSVIFIIYCRFKVHRQKLHRSYDEIELPKNQLAQPVQTKRWYQQQYKMARKYQYNISVAYLEIENWQDLSFRFNRKILTDVSQVIAVIINENIDEEDYAGVISDGEYLFLCPHQTPEQVLIKFTRIKQAIKIRFFANLGGFSVKVNFSINSPSIQDIDPYVFLARLSEGRETKI